MKWARVSEGVSLACHDDDDDVVLAVHLDSAEPVRSDDAALVFISFN